LNRHNRHKPRTKTATGDLHRNEQIYKKKFDFADAELRLPSRAEKDLKTTITKAFREILLARMLSKGDHGKERTKSEYGINNSYWNPDPEDGRTGNRDC